MAELTKELKEFIAEQKIFFVATAPLTAEGKVNLSPKGLDTFRILSDTEVCYLDLTGSGIETISHVNENGRLTIMFCSFGQKPLILRLWGKGTVVLPEREDFDELNSLFNIESGVRSIIKLKIEKIGESCGYAVPKYEFLGERDTLIKWSEKKGEDGIQAFREEWNKESLDGLPGLKL